MACQKVLFQIEDHHYAAGVIKELNLMLEINNKLLMVLYWTINFGNINDSWNLIIVITGS